jgi:osmotically-inducible protein OsmY
MGKLRTMLFAGAAGAAVMYFLDPDRGEGRRAMARDRVNSVVRRGGMNIERQVRYREGQAGGLVHEVRTRGQEGPPADDIALKDRVESEVFGRRGFPKGKVNVEVIDGRARIDGELESQAEIDEVVDEVKSVAGVREVESYLHLKGTDAPNKAAARRAG